MRRTSNHAWELAGSTSMANTSVVIDDDKLIGSVKYQVKARVVTDAVPGTQPNQLTSLDSGVIEVVTGDKHTHGSVGTVEIETVGASAPYQIKITLDISFVGCLSGPNNIEQTVDDPNKEIYVEVYRIDNSNGNACRAGSKQVTLIFMLDGTYSGAVYDIYINGELVGSVDVN
jgi:hypothetical protein